ncbi:hypothetical protein VTN31DRAFT_5208 [Thermomyces dupontii]|uniref:uncharacterized protein n=1 Tax=Talaromyces thermophilus TaxID=28565 RepID=UPI0037434583
MHRPPGQLLEFLPPGKSVTVPNKTSCAGGVVWLPNNRLSDAACNLLRTAEKLARPTSEDADEERSNDDLHLSLDGLSINEHREMAQKLDTTHARLLKRVRLEALATEGVHAVQLWSMALKMIVVSRAILLDDGRRPNSGQAATNGSVRASKPTGARLTSGPFHPNMDADTFDAMFPALGAVTGGSDTAKRTLPAQKATKAALDDRATPGFRFGLPLELWRRIIAEAVGAECILSRAQQVRVLEYVGNWGSLEQELTVSGAAEHQQIWKMLESVGCFEYEG